MKTIKNVIYKAVNVVNGKVYIGLTTDPFDKRHRAHRNNSRNPSLKGYNYHIYRAIRKYGWEAFEWEFIDKVSPSLDKKSAMALLSEKEKYWIKFYDSFKNGYNNTEGGEGVVGIHAGAKLTIKQVVEVKNLLMRGLGIKEISETYKLHPTTVRCIERNRNWIGIEVVGWSEWLDSREYAYRLTEKDVIEIKNLLMSGRTQNSLAIDYNVRESTINNLASELNWKHVEVDGWEKWLSSKSINAHNVKLTKEKVIEIKRLIIQGLSQRAIAIQVGCAKTTVSKISRNELKLWSSVSFPEWDEYIEAKVS